MKKDAAFGIALMVAGILGLIFPPQFKLGAEQPLVNSAHVLHSESKAEVVLLKYGVDASAATAANCSRKLRTAAEKASLLDKVGVVLADLNSVVSLQGLASGM
jgi:hypothetical protein